MTDVWFSADAAYTVDLNAVEIPEEIAALPEVTGSGNIPGLRQARARNLREAAPELAEERFRDGIHLYATASCHIFNQWQNQYLIIQYYGLLRITSMWTLLIASIRSGARI
jgi:hypothetical protein